MKKNILYIWSAIIAFVVIVIVVLISFIFGGRPTYNSNQYYEPKNEGSPQDSLQDSKQSSEDKKPKKQVSNSGKSDKKSIFDTKHEVGEPSPVPTITKFDEECVYYHNFYRSFHIETPNLTLSDVLSGTARQKAEEMARTGVFAHTPDIKYGENLFYSSKTPGSKADFDGMNCKRASELWYNEETMYDYSDPTPNKATGHFTQLVWKNSRQVGCDKGYSTKGSTVYLYVVCHYNPAGNYIGEYQQNVMNKKTESKNFKSNIEPIHKNRKQKSKKSQI